MLKKKVKIKFLIILIILILSPLIFKEANLKESFILDEKIEKDILNLNQPDLVGPNITFVQPNTNYTIISKGSYEIIVNITDENPPNPGDVLLYISEVELIDPLFNVSMSPSGDELWTYNWDNISSYKNRQFYIIWVWAKDSSPNETSSLSEMILIYLNLPSEMGLSLLRNVLYIIVVSAIFALIIFYINRKFGYSRSIE
ncbi:MAG: hypothetical protein ACFFA6_01240 [Promethearchaeota archaeon]